MAGWAMSRKEGLGQVGAGPGCQAPQGKEETRSPGPCGASGSSVSEEWQEPPHFTGGQTKAREWVLLPRGGPGTKRAFRSLQAWLGWAQAGMCTGRRHPPRGQCPALRLWLWAWQQAQPSPQQLQVSLLTGASKKTLYIFRLTLNECSFHLSPPPSLPTLSRGLPRTALNRPPPASSGFLLATRRLPRPQPPSQPGREQNKPRIDRGRKENHKLPGPAEGVSWVSPAGLGVTPDYKTLCQGLGGWQHVL